MNKLTSTFARLRRSDDGATLVEYGIALGLAIALGAGALSVLAADVGGSMSAASAALPSAAAPSTTDGG